MSERTSTAFPGHSVELTDDHPALSILARAAMRTHPEAERRVRGVLHELGPGLSDRDIQSLEDRAIHHLDLDQLNAFRDMSSTVPVILNAHQKALADALMRRAGDDGLGDRARKAYAEALRRGAVKVR